jgi:hypothetical protein
LCGKDVSENAKVLRLAHDVADFAVFCEGSLQVAASDGRLPGQEPDLCLARHSLGLQRDVAHGHRLLGCPVGRFQRLLQLPLISVADGQVVLGKRDARSKIHLLKGCQRHRI